MRICLPNKGRLIVILSLLVAITAGMLLFGSLTYSVWCHADLRAFLFPARDFAEGYYPVHYPPYEFMKDGVPSQGRWFYVYFKEHQTGRLISHVTHGFPVLLALSIAMFGKMAPFLFNTFLLGLLPPVLFITVRQLLPTATDRNTRDSIALLSSFCIVLIPWRVLATMTAPYRDLAQYIFMLVSLGLLASSGKHRKWAWLAAGLMFGGAVWIREHALFFLPVYLLLALWPVRGTRRRTDIAFFFGGLAVGLLPYLAQNWFDRGGILTMSQFHLVRNAASQTGQDFKFYRIIPQTLPYIKGAVLGALGPWGIAAVVGLVLAPLRFRKLSVVMGLMLLECVLINASGKSWWTRYQFAPFLFALPFLAVGLHALAGIPSKLARKILHRDWKLLRPVLLIILVGLFFFPWLSKVLQPHERWTITEANRFQADFSRHVPTGSITVAEGTTRCLVEYLTPSFAVSIGDLENVHRNFDGTIDNILKSGQRVFYFDAETVEWGRNPWHYAFQRVDVRNAMLDHFDLVDRAEFNADSYDMRWTFDCDKAILYEVVKRTNLAAHVVCRLPPVAPYLMRINLRSTTAGTVNISCSGEEMSIAAQPGWNYLLLPASAGTNGNLPITLSSTSGTPADLDAVVFSRRALFRLDLGKHTDPPDRYFLKEAHIHKVETTREGRDITDTATFTAPTPVEPSGCVELRIALLPTTGMNGSDEWTLETKSWHTNFWITESAEPSEYRFFVPGRFADSPATEFVLRRQRDEEETNSAPSFISIDTIDVIPYSDNLTILALGPGLITYDVLTREEEKTGTRVRVVPGDAPTQITLGLDGILAGGVRYVSTLPVVSDMTDDGPIQFEHFHAREQGPSGPSRWTRDVPATIRIPVAGARSVVVRLLLGPSYRPDNVSPAHVQVTDDLRSNMLDLTVAAEPVQAVLHMTAIPSSAEFVTVHIVSDSWCPADYGSPDTRRLGIKLEKLEVDYE
jgi:hypothetical protein